MVRIGILVCLWSSLSTGGAANWAGYLQGHNKNNFDWKAACTALGQQPAGYGMSGSGGKSTFSLTCDNNKITVVCDAAHCTSTYKPPATAGDTPPTGAYNKKVTARAPANCQGFNQQDAQKFLDIHNKMRCAVGTPPVTWDANLECQCQQTEMKMGGFTHSKSYDLKIPSGENLATGNDVMNAAFMWFTEYLMSGGNYWNQAHGIGHYTAMVWKSVKTIGCGIGRKHGKDGVIRCQYSGGGGKNTAPNFGGAAEYKANLPAFHGKPADFTKCGLTVGEVKSKVQMYKKWGILQPKGQELANLGFGRNEL